MPQPLRSGIRQSGITGDDAKLRVDGHHRTLNGDEHVLIKSAGNHDGDCFACEVQAAWIGLLYGSVRCINLPC